MHLTPTAIQDLLHTQIATLIGKRYVGTTSLTSESVQKKIIGLHTKIASLKVGEVDTENGYLPMVIVVKSGTIDAEHMMSQVVSGEKQGITKLNPNVPQDFSPIAEATIPQGDVYLLVDIDRGSKYLNVRPSDAFTHIQKEGRTPLTIDEGIAILTHYPAFLKRNNCFSLLASRNHTKRVPALWLNRNHEPNLGWCWNGNPHTWLGSASAKLRIRL